MDWHPLKIRAIRALGYKVCSRHGWVWASGLYCPRCTHEGHRPRPLR